MLCEEGVVTVHEHAVLQQHLSKPAVKSSSSWHVLMNEEPHVLRKENNAEPNMLGVIQEVKGSCLPANINILCAVKMLL